MVVAHALRENIYWRHTQRALCIAGFLCLPERRRCQGAHPVLRSCSIQSDSNQCEAGLRVTDVAGHGRLQSN